MSQFDEFCESFIILNERGINNGIVSMVQALITQSPATLEKPVIDEKEFFAWNQYLTHRDEREGITPETDALAQSIENARIQTDNGVAGITYRMETPTVRTYSARKIG